MTWRAWCSGSAACVRTSILTASTTPAPHPARRVTPQNRWSQRSHKDFAETLRRPRLAATVETWWPAIEAAIITDYSNARSEGYNRLAKHEGRNAFGFRNPVNQRRRIGWACTRQYRRLR